MVGSNAPPMLLREGISYAVSNPTISIIDLQVTPTVVESSSYNTSLAPASPIGPWEKIGALCAKRQKRDSERLTGHLLSGFRVLCHVVPFLPGRVLRYAGFRLFTDEMYSPLGAAGRKSHPLR